MYIAYAVLAVLLSVALTGSAGAKLTKNEKVVGPITALGVPPKMLPVLAYLELAGAAGLLIGLFYGPLGVAAAVGVVLYFLGAIGAHVRSSDWKGIPSPTILLLLAAGVLVLRMVSL